jgi:hypothetical protein
LAHLERSLAHSLAALTWLPTTETALNSEKV